jgi:hypothetical protein
MVLSSGAIIPICGFGIFEVTVTICGVERSVTMGLPVTESIIVCFSVFTVGWVEKILVVG